MKKILVIGSSGAGKSVLARRLGDITGLPVIHLDQHHWQPGWTEPPKDVWNRQVTEIVKGDEWIIDGNFDRTMDLRLQSSDTVIFMDFPRHICIWRILKRVLTYHGNTRPDMAEGCPEKIDFPFLLWVWNFPKRSRLRIIERIARVTDRVKLYHLKSSREVDEFLASFTRDYASNGKRTDRDHKRP